MLLLLHRQRAHIVPGNGDIAVALRSWLRQPTTILAFPFRIAARVAWGAHRVARIIPVAPTCRCRVHGGHFPHSLCATRGRERGGRACSSVISNQRPASHRGTLEGPLITAQCFAGNMAPLIRSHHLASVQWRVGPYIRILQKVQIEPGHISAISSYIVYIPYRAMYNHTFH
jgi:hypothetical protein